MQNLFNWTRQAANGIEQPIAESGEA